VSGLEVFTHKTGLCSVRWSVDGRLLVSGHANGNLCFWDVKNTKKPVHEIAGLHTQMIVSVSIGLHTGAMPCPWIL
jgi:WD40 repeat protein